MTPDATALYYFTSTIAQTFAAIIALLTALVLFRLQSASEDLRDAAEQLTSNFYDTEEQKDRLRVMIVEGAFGSVLRFYTDGEGAHPERGKGTKFRRLVDALATHHDSYRSLLAGFRRALIACSLLILAAIASIPAIPSLSNSPAATWGEVGALSLLLVWGVVECGRLAAGIVSPGVGPHEDSRSAITRFREWIGGM
ncbi:MAG: hypothetical protein HY275_03525 [Gemmatimonadetes bacterium]|nr:hypothetical protein [Gemmatimonadota bacterium]